MSLKMPAKTTVNRRDFLSLLSAATLAAAAPTQLFAATPAPRSKRPEPFTFLFVTDAHLQPELNGVAGTDLAFKKARAIKADFAINGGDHVFDALAVTKQRALSLFDLYGKTEQDLGLKVHHTIGNHDILGINLASGIPATDPLYGKKLFADRFGPTYYSFNHKGHHFIVLDTVAVTDDHLYEGRVDPAQLQWLAADLAALAPGTPIIVTAHIPIVTAYLSYLPKPPKPYPHHSISVINADEVLALFAGQNILGVLQGHTHVNETILWKGVPYITSGAVCGNWWQGTHLGTPEGFTVVSVANNKLTTRFIPSGFQTIDPHNT